MNQKLNNWKQKFDNTLQELNEVKLAYSNLLHDVLSFNELISKKEHTGEILTLVLRLARSIIDFTSGVILNFEGSDFKVVHSINVQQDFQQRIEHFISHNKYQDITIKQRVEVITIDSNNTRIIVPIVTKQQTIGLFDLLVNISANDIKQQDLDLLWILASIAAIEFESVQMSNRSELLTLMLSSLEKINSEDKLDNLLYLILNNLKQIVPAASYLLILRDTLLDVTDNYSYCIPEIHSLDETCLLVDECIKAKDTVFIKKLSEHHQCENCTEKYLHSEHDGSLMLVPLYKGSLGYGVISIFDKDESGDIFSQYNRHIIEIFAKQATIAINNAILIDQQKKSNQSLAKANEELFVKNKELDSKKNELLQKQNELQKAHDELSKKNKILSKEIESAGVIQLAILSKIDKPEDIDFHIEYLPHHSIGGDYFGIVNLDESKTLIYAGDVSGKGVPAAITNGFLKNEFSFIINKLNLAGDISPAKVLTEVNLSSMNVFKVTEQFTSAWCGLINSTTKKLVYASAGHDYPILIKDKAIFLDDNNGPIMGLSETTQYKDKEIDFDYPTKLFLYTDGLTDQETITGKRLGREWVLNKIYDFRHYPPETLCKTVVAEVIKAAKGVDQHDDMLAIVLSLRNLS